MRRARRRLTATAAALALTISLAACAGGADPATGSSADSAGPAESAQAGAHNDADTQFAQMMIVHHEGAVAMAQLAVDEATTPEVTALGARIAAAQGPEIELMAEWLDAWGEDRTAMDMEGMDGMEGMDALEMGGLDQSEVMSELGGIDGGDFDARFLELMVAHHEGAIEMSEVELRSGQSDDALALAAAIIDAQTAEIAEMRGLLAGS